MAVTVVDLEQNGAVAVPTATAAPFPPAEQALRPSSGGAVARERGPDLSPASVEMEEVSLDATALEKLKAPVALAEPRAEPMPFVSNQKHGFDASFTSSSSVSLFAPPVARGPMGWKATVLRAVDHPLTIFVSVLVTLWALLGDDLRILTVRAPQDHYFLPPTIACIVYFTTETALLSLSRPNYFLKFYFWLDVLSTLSLFFDVPSIYNAAVSRTGASGSSTGTAGTLSVVGSTVNSAAKVGQILRLVRLARSVSFLQLEPPPPPPPRSNSNTVVRIFESATGSLRRALRSASSLSAGGGLGGEPRQTRLGQKLSDLTTRRVIIGVWCILLVMPLFNAAIYPMANPNTYEQTGLDRVDAAWTACLPAANGTTTASSALPLLQLSCGGCGALAAGLLDSYVNASRGLLSLTVGGYDLTSAFNLPGVADDTRDFELLIVRSGDASTASFDRVKLYRMAAGLHLGRTLFLICMLAGGVLVFSRDADKLVLQPIERMMRKVEDISDNPLIGLHVKEGLAKDGKANSENYETRILEKSINKICSLMALGFGDAGAEVIGENMRNGGALNPMVPGKKKCAIFGFCDIRHFTDATEVLQEDVMEFVNAIARIVHSEVAHHGGSANKNIGDAFLLVWKFPPEVTPEEVTALAAGDLRGVSEAARAAAAQVADNALSAFVMIAARLRHSPQLAHFCAHPGLAARLPGFTVRLGFGLHVGWAIEGAIGSEYKVDASYLSPHVNIASRLEAATKQYGVPMLLSDHIARLLSPDVRAQCRTLDRVTLKGSATPLGLVTFDTEPGFIPTPAPSTKPDPSRLHASASTVFSSGSEELASHTDVVSMHRTVSPAFLERFKAGYELYVAGRWGEAKDILSAPDVLGGRARMEGGPPAPQDGPSAALLAVMAAQGNRAPAGWAGYRELTEK